MFRIESKVDTNSADFKENDKLNREAARLYKERLDQVKPGGSEKARKLHTDRNKILPRERVERLLDKNTPFLELSSLAAYDMYDSSMPGAGMITGIGMVHGREVMIVANDATVKGGTYVPETIKKHIRAQVIALENNLPCIYLVDSGGIFLPRQLDMSSSIENER